MAGPKSSRASLYQTFVNALAFFGKPHTRQELAAHLGVNGMAAYRLIQGMRDAGVLIERPQPNGTYVYVATKRLRAK